MSVNLYIRGVSVFCAAFLTSWGLRLVLGWPALCFATSSLCASTFPALACCTSLFSTTPRTKTGLLVTAPNKTCFCWCCSECCLLCGQTVSHGISLLSLPSMSLLEQACLHVAWEYAFGICRWRTLPFTFRTVKGPMHLGCSFSETVLGQRTGSASVEP